MTSIIGIENKDGSVEYITCKYSDPVVLANNFINETNVKALISLGSLAAVDFNLKATIIANKKWKSKPKVKVSSIRSLINTVYQTDNPEFICLFKDNQWFIQESATSSLRPLIGKK